MVKITSEVILNKEVKKTQKSLNFCLKLLKLDVDPFESVFLKRPWLRFILAMTYSASVIVFCAIYMWVNYADLTTSKIAELWAVMNSLARSMIFLSSTFLLNRRGKQLMTKILQDREYKQSNKRFWPLIESYSKFEWRFLKFFYAIMTFAAASAFIVNPYAGITKTRLTADFTIPFLPCDGFSFNWLINYIYQIGVAIITVQTSCYHFGMTFLVMSHACFKIDTAMVTIGRFGERFEQERVPVKYWRIYNHSIIKNRMIKAVEETVDLMEYSKMARDYIATTNCADTLMICFAMCTALFSFKFSHFHSMVCVWIIVISILLLLIYHYAGQQMNNKLEDLSTSVYLTPWHNLHFRKQKDIFFMLLVLQNFRGFHGIFFDLCNATFYKILDFTNSLFSAMQSMW